MILLSISPFIFIQCGSGERRTAVPRCALFVLSEISAARRIRRLFALPQHLPQSRHRAAELFLAAGVSRHQPKKYSKRS